MRLSAAVGLLALLPLLLSGCSDDPVAPTGTPLESLWPSEDGRSWAYAMHTEWWPSSGDDSAFLYGSSDEVPDAPTFGELYLLIDNPVTPDPTETTDTWYRLQFHGNITTGSGVTAQNLVETRGDDHFPKPASSVVGSDFMAHLARARPDLFPEVYHAASHPSLGLDPLFLHGGPWRRTGDWIGSYGDQNQDPSWRFLEGDPLVGDRFTFQLVPDLAPDVFLKAIVRDKVNIETPVGTFIEALEVVYLLDFGISVISGVGGPDILGFYRLISYGNIVYAPTVGPVKSYERVNVYVGEKPGDGRGHLSLDLIEITAGDP